MRRTACGWLAVLGGVLVAAAARGEEVRHVVLISVDGLPAYLLDDPEVPLPAIRGLARQGTSAAAMTVSNPSVTWPNHTSLMTGVHADRHGVLFNGLLARGGPREPVAVDPRRDQAELVAVPTIFDAARAAGLSTAAINWPCTRNDASIDDDFPDTPETFDHMTPRLRQSLIDDGVLTEELIAQFNRLSPAARDDIWTDAACHVIRTRQPRLLAFHLLNVDAVHHRYGPKTWAGASAVAYADACIARVLEALDEAGIREQTAVLVVADHGFITLTQGLNPNALLREEEFLTVEGGQIREARAMAVATGGTAGLYLLDPETADQDREALKHLFEGREGIAAVLTPADYPEHALPAPGDNPGMADLVLAAEDGYAFSASPGAEGFVTPTSPTYLGTHGFLAENPLMDAVFVASGAGIRAGSRVDRVANIDVAPTLARLLGLELEHARGRVLEEILDLDPE